MYIMILQTVNLILSLFPFANTLGEYTWDDHIGNPGLLHSACLEGTVDPGLSVKLSVYYKEREPLAFTCNCEYFVFAVVGCYYVYFSTCIVIIIIAAVIDIFLITIHFLNCMECTEYHMNVFSCLKITLFVFILIFLWLEEIPLCKEKVRYLFC